MRKTKSIAVPESFLIDLSAPILGRRRRIVIPQIVHTIGSTTSKQAVCKLAFRRDIAAETSVTWRGERYAMPGDVRHLANALINAWKKGVVTCEHLDGPEDHYVNPNWG